MTIRNRTLKALGFIIALGATTGATLGAAPAHAALGDGDDHHLVLNTFAYHFKNADERNDFTPGIGWEYSPTSSFGFHFGTLSDSFGYQAKYAGINYATRRLFNNRVRLIAGATVLHKQYAKNADPETKILPLPAIEFTLAERAVLNVSGSPAVDFADQKNNAVVWFQLKLGLL